MRRPTFSLLLLTLAGGCLLSAPILAMGTKAAKSPVPDSAPVKTTAADGDTKQGDAKQGDAAKAETPAAPTANTVPVAVTVEYGKATAPITVEEFASLSCSHCAEFSKTVYPELKKKYLDGGKVRLITHSYIRNEPDMRGTMLLHCLKNNEERQQFIKVLFEMQEQWAFAENVTDTLGDIAKVGGMDQEAYLACVKNPKLETGLLKDLQSLSDTRDIAGTPTFYVNGVKHNGAFDIGTLSKSIDSAKPSEKKEE